MLLGLQNNLPPLTILSMEQVDEIHQASLKVLKNTGVRVLSQQALDILKENKCEIKSNTVFIDSELIEDVLHRCPSSFTWFSVHPDSQKHIKLESGRVNYTISHSPTHIIDFKGKRRRSTYQDIEDMTRLGDALEMMHLGGSGLSGTVEEIDQGLDLMTAAAYRFIYEVKNTDKPLFIPPSGMTPEDGLEFFNLFREDLSELQKKPCSWAWVNTVSPLMHNETMIEYALGFAMFGLPVLFCPEVMAHATGPATLGGTLVQHNAEVLSGIVICQLANESYGIAPPPPIVYGTASSILDPRTAQITLGAPEAGLMNVLTAQMARHYNLPTRGTAGCTDSKVLDAQAGQEAAMNALLASMGGVNLIVNAFGGLGPGIQAASYAAMVFNNESLKAINRVLRGIEISDEALAVDVIHDVGPGGEYLSHSHTLKHFRSEFFLPKLFDRTDFEVFEKSEKQDFVMRANEIAYEIINSHQPPKLDKYITKQLDEIMKNIHKKYVIK
ncbi:MAG: trimethylamine methyltransferase family protein [Candidatus Heimdallarchaeota archaeon]|nr:MAG: trimethylamine methyltransferase family protein [Candidatus Heimdallarchaeota archaeon]